MTSMPASRSARAMIFAPRSWPSRPGFAITTRIGRAMASSVPRPSTTVPAVTTILGVNAYHADSAACLVVDGEIVAAAEEERFRRLKHWAGVPSEAIAWCLGDAGIRLGDVDHLALNKQPRANLRPKLRYA